jgi:hypothetical protein
MPEVIIYSLLLSYEKMLAVKLPAYFQNIQISFDKMVQHSPPDVGYLWYTTYDFPGGITEGGSELPIKTL